MTQQALPHFIIGGAPRSGTTWLHHALSRHPDIFLTTPIFPEPKFFLVDEFYEQGLDHYRQQWFSKAPPRAVVGEKSTNYLESGTSARRIRQDLPGVRLVFILREPVDRAFNNWLWSRMNGVENEDFETALDLEPEREANVPPRLRYARPHALFSRGLYADLLATWFALFPVEQILCLRYEDLIDNASGLLASLHRHIGLAERPGDADGLGVINRAADEEDMVIPAQLKQRLEAAYAEPNRRLAALLPNFPVWRY